MLGDDYCEIEAEIEAVKRHIEIMRKLNFERALKEVRNERSSYKCLARGDSQG